MFTLNRKPLNKVGKKTREWNNARNRLKRKFAAMGITTCELNYIGCWKTEALGFLHIRKRRHLKPGELEICVLGCNPCHDKAERLPEEAMTAILLSVIAEREGNR